MLNKEMIEWGSMGCEIRSINEYGEKRKKEVGSDKVYNFTIGTPSLTPPKELIDNMKEILDSENDLSTLFSYTSAEGLVSLRNKISEKINVSHCTSYSYENIIMTHGASSGLAASIKGICNKGDEIIVITPYFSEYDVFIKSNKGVVVKVDSKNDFSLDVNKIIESVNKKTKAIIINSPNNPSGAVYNSKDMEELCNRLEEKEKELEKSIYIICDEPYRELVYEDINISFLPKLYKHTIYLYSYSKTLSLSGERIGYILLNELGELKVAIMGAMRALGYICVSHFFQRVLEESIDSKVDILEYDENRKLLYNMLSEIGYECNLQSGAFYMFIKSLEEDDKEFCKKAMEEDLLIVPGECFNKKGYVRIAYCVDRRTILNSREAFKKLYNKYTTKRKS